METSSIPGWMVTLVGMAATLVPAATLYFQRADARYRVSKADADKRRSYERECTRVFDEYVELRQILLIIDGVEEKDRAGVNVILKKALAEDVLPDPARHLYDADEAAKK